MSTPFTQRSLDLGAQSVSRNSAIVAEALNTLSAQGGIEARGAVFTRPEVVDFILDLVGYTPDRPLHNYRLLEPAFGGGDFLLAAIDRLLAAWSSAERTVHAHVENLRCAVFAVELHSETFNATRSAVISRLHAAGIHLKDSEDLADHWLAKDDFLLTQIDTEFDFVVGNPPYVRQELIPPPLLAEYRKRFQTFHDRADLYIPFIERSLLSLANGGIVGFICADRWMKNRYGETLRQMIDREFHLKIYVDMVDTQAFQSEVAAYPAIFVIERDTPGATRIAHRPAIEHGQLHALARELRSSTHPSSSSGVRQVPRVTNSTAPWLLDTPDQVDLIRTVESRFPLLEDAGCKVGIGVATGADDVFIGDFRVLDVEEERKLPLVTTKDIAAGVVNWQGQGIVNPYLADGRLAKLEDYPRLRQYLETRREVIANRHCAKKTPDRWYRTIDRIYPELTVQPKLLIPDIKGTAHVVFEEGKYYPHHNLYYITSNAWDLHALQAVLLSSLTETFMLAYSTKMRGGYLRFQAQYLRRLRLPFWHDVSHELKLMLIEAAQVRDVEACNEATYRLYGLPASSQREIPNTP